MPCIKLFGIKHVQNINRKKLRQIQVNLKISVNKIAKALMKQKAV